MATFLQEKPALSQLPSSTLHHGGGQTVHIFQAYETFTLRKQQRRRRRQRRRQRGPFYSTGPLAARGKPARRNSNSLSTLPAPLSLSMLDIPARIDQSDPGGPSNSKSALLYTIQQLEILCSEDNSCQVKAIRTRETRRATIKNR